MGTLPLVEPRFAPGSAPVEPRIESRAATGPVGVVGGTVAGRTRDELNTMALSTFAYILGVFELLVGIPLLGPIVGLFAVAAGVLLLLAGNVLQ